MAFEQVGISIFFKGEGVNEKGYVTACSNPEFQVEEGTVVVAVDPAYFRPTEVELLIGDPTKANTQLGWKPKYDLKMLVEEMVAVDVDHFRKDRILKAHGYVIKNQYE
jgi:GDPmannose 4,6-dehydratase